MTRANFKRAAESICYKLLGRFHVTDVADLIRADIQVDIPRKQLLTNFHYGFDDVIHYTGPLEMPADSADQENESRFGGIEAWLAAQYRTIVSYLT